MTDVSTAFISKLETTFGDQMMDDIYRKQNEISTRMNEVVEDLPEGSAEIVIKTYMLLTIE